MYDDVYVFMYGVNSLYVKSNRYFFMFISIFISRVLKFLCTLLSCGQENSSFAYTVRRTRHQNFAKRGLTEEKILMNFLSHCLSPNVKVNMAYYFKSSFLLCDILTTSLLRFLSRFYELSWKNVYIMLYCPSKVFGFLWDMERKSWMNDFFLVWLFKILMPYSSEFFGIDSWNLHELPPGDKTIVYTPSNIRVFARKKVLAKCFKICHFSCRAISYTTQVRYSKFWAQTQKLRGVR